MIWSITHIFRRTLLLCRVCQYSACRTLWLRAESNRRGYAYWQNLISGGRKPPDTMNAGSNREILPERTRATSRLVGSSWVNIEFAKPQSLPIGSLSTSLSSGGEELRRVYAYGQSLARGGREPPEPWIRGLRGISVRAYALGSPTLKTGLLPHPTLWRGLG